MSRREEYSRWSGGEQLPEKGSRSLEEIMSAYRDTLPGGLTPQERKTLKLAMAEMGLESNPEPDEK